MDNNVHSAPRKGQAVDGKLKYLIRRLYTIGTLGDQGICRVVLFIKKHFTDTNWSNRPYFLFIGVDGKNTSGNYNQLPVP